MSTKGPISVSLLIIVFCLFLLAVLGLHCCTGFSVVVESEGSPLIVVQRLTLRWLLLLPSTGSGAPSLQCLEHMGSVVVVPRP